ncbi:MAG: hypothetical protein JWQ74_3493 [Marmoricola sp.]|nr:hypothetical protein [Marmoricola sp.]
MSSCDAFSGLRIFENSVVLVHTMLNIEVIRVRGRPMAIKRLTDLRLVCFGVAVAGHCSFLQRSINGCGRCLINATRCNRWLRLLSQSTRRDRRSMENADPFTTVAQARAVFLLQRPYPVLPNVTGSALAFGHSHRALRIVRTSLK